MVQSIKKRTGYRFLRERKNGYRMIKSEHQVTYEEHGEALEIRVSGEIDHHCAVAVRAGIDDVLAARRPPRVFLELSGVSFMDSSGLGLIMGRYSLMRKIGGELSVMNPNKRIIDIFELAGLQRMIKIEKQTKKKVEERK